MHRQIKTKSLEKISPLKHMNDIKNEKELEILIQEAIIYGQEIDMEFG